MNLTWFSVIAVLGGLAVFLTLVALTASFLYHNRPESDEKNYFWDDQ